MPDQQGDHNPFKCFNCYDEFIVKHQLIGHRKQLHEKTI